MGLFLLSITVGQERGKLAEVINTVYPQVKICSRHTECVLSGQRYLRARWNLFHAYGVCTGFTKLVIRPEIQTGFSKDQERGS